MIPDLQLYAIKARNMSSDKIATIDTKSIFFFYFIRFFSNLLWSGRCTYGPRFKMSKKALRIDEWCITRLVKKSQP